MKQAGDTEATVYPLLDLASLHLLEGRWDELASLNDAERLAGRGWADLPPAFGDDSTAHRSFQQWRADGTWECIRRIVPSDDHMRFDERLPL